MQPKEEMKKNNYLIANILISLVIASRFIPEVGHYTPVFAVLILTAMIFEKKFMYIPFVGIFASDMLLEYFNYYEFSYLFSSLFFLNYLSYFLVYLVISNDNYNQKDSYSSILCNTIFNTIFAPTLFFILSNFVVWVTAGGIFYPYTLSGLFYCYEMGLPFYKQHLISTMIFVPILFVPLMIARSFKSSYLFSK